MSEAHREIAVVCGPHSKAGSTFCLILLLAAQAESKDQDTGDLAGNPTAKVYMDKNWDKFAKDILELQNKVRKDPKSFIPHLEKQSKKFDGLKLFKEDGVQFTETREGAKAYTDAVTFLRKQRPRGPFKWCEQLHLACKDHVDDIAPKGLVQSGGSDGSYPTDRILKYGRLDESWAAACIYGAINTKEVIERLIVCDG